jgi:hypothetical protein
MQPPNTKGGGGLDRTTHSLTSTSNEREKEGKREWRKKRTVRNKLKRDSERRKQTDINNSRTVNATGLANGFERNLI